MAGTSLPHKEEDFAALGYSSLAPVGTVALATSTMAYTHSKSGGQDDPLPSQSRPSSYSGLAPDAGGDKDGDITSDDFQIRRWHEEMDAMQLDRFDDDASTHQEATQPATTAGGDVVEDQTTPSTPPITAVDKSIPSAKSGPEGEGQEANDAENDDSMGLEQRPATRTSRSLKTKTTAPDRPIRSRKSDAPGPSTRATSGNENLRLYHDYHL